MPGHKHRRAGTVICLVHWMYKPQGAGHTAKDKLNAYTVSSNEMSMGSGITSLG